MITSFLRRSVRRIVQQANPLYQFLFLSMVAIFWSVPTPTLYAQWSTATLSQARQDLAATAAGTKVFFAGGHYSGSGFSSVVDIYENTTNTWSVGALSQARSKLCATAVGSKVFFAGGNTSDTDYSNVVDIYDINTDTWTTSTLSVARGWFSATSSGNKVFFAGGFSTSAGFSNVVDIYDTSTDTWTTATLSQARYTLSAISAGTKVFFAGGYNTTSGASDVVDIYDVSTDTWTTATLSQARSNMGVAAIGTKVFFAGGWPSSGYSNVVDIYDIATNTWTTTTLSQQRGFLGGAAAGSKAFFAGGYNGSYSDAVDIYDDNTGIRTKATLSQARAYFGSASVGTKVFFGGGYNPAFGFSDVVDIYDTTPDPSCHGGPQVTAQVIVDACVPNTVILDAGLFSAYKWFTGETTRTITISQSGTYDVEVTDSHGCKGADKVSVIINNDPSCNPGGPAIQALSIAPACSQSPRISRRWKLTNPNSVPIRVDWEITGSIQKTWFDLPPGESYLTTILIPKNANVLKIYWHNENGEIQSAQHTPIATKCSGNASARTAAEESANEEIGLPVRVYPNPGSTVITIQITSENDMEIPVQIISGNGIVNQQNNIHLSAGLNFITQDVSKLSSGFYVIKAGQQTVRFVKE